MASFRKWALAIFAGASMFAPAIPADARGGPNEVDVELVLAVDISYSMDYEEQRLQREGYIQALTSKEVLDAVRQGAVGRIAVTYVEWAGINRSNVIVPWQVIDSRESADSFVAKIAAAPIRRDFRTSISGALMFSAALFENNGFDAVRRVIDVSGDGANNEGPPVVTVRNNVLKDGIVINGLPILINNNRRSSFDMENLDEYYRDCVIGGPGAFLIPVTERHQFVDAIRTKIVREIATAPLPSDVSDEFIVVPVQAEATRRVDCFVGERQWQERYRN